MPYNKDLINICEINETQELYYNIFTQSIWIYGVFTVCQVLHSGYGDRKLYKCHGSYPQETHSLRKTLNRK